ncbi:uncharacterized protein LOC119725019 [Patiria miniata]|uniref:C-type lectin domain-containing protein n=1 Tax=Patiria miniata TaxID=46514 RepID=A0A913ZMM9_PATMI|nr:uncharacterized protein LOC119725019 [Patiria miniata]
MNLHPKSPLLLRAILLLSTILAGDCCPAGWHREGSFCFNVVYFESQGDRLDWGDAEAACMKDGGHHLASIHTAQQQYYVYETIVQETNTGYWIGLTDADAEGAYTWIDGTDGDVFFWNTNRSPAEPDGGKGQDCVFIYKDEGGEMTDRDNAWGDDGCMTKNNYICGEPAYVLVPDVENQCIDAAQANVSLTWTGVTALKPGTIVVGSVTCIDSLDGASISLTGGDFGLGSHTITCSASFMDGTMDWSSFTFNVTALPSLTVPTVSTQTLGTGQSTVTVAWAEVTATNSDAQPITCSDSGDGTGLSVTGGDFGLGSHTVTCNVTNSDGCTAAESFTFDVTGGSNWPVIKN